MNTRIICFLKNVMECNHWNYEFVSEKTGIAYQRIIRIFEHYDMISGSELLCLCQGMGIKEEDFMALADGEEEIHPPS